MKSTSSRLWTAGIAVSLVLGASAASAAPLFAARAGGPSANIVTVQDDHGFRHYRGYAYYNGHRGYRYYRPGWRPYNGWYFPPAAFSTGVIVGGAIARPPVVAMRPAGSAHLRWCYDRYRSYRACDYNTYKPTSCPRRQCISPFG